MQLQEMFKKLEGYNTLANIYGDEDRFIEVEIDRFWFTKAKNYKELVSKLKKEWTDEVVKSICSNSYEFYETKVNTYTDYHNITREFEIKVSFVR